MYKLSGYILERQHWHARHSKQCKHGSLQQISSKHVERMLWPHSMLFVRRLSGMTT